MLIGDCDFQGQIAISLRSEAQHQKGGPQAGRIWALTLKMPAPDFLHPVRTEASNGFGGRITISLRSEAQHPQGGPQVRGICAPRKRPIPIPVPFGP